MLHTGHFLIKQKSMFSQRLPQLHGNIELYWMSFLTRGDTQSLFLKDDKCHSLTVITVLILYAAEK